MGCFECDVLAAIDLMEKKLVTALQDKQLRLMHIAHNQQVAAMERDLHRMSTAMAENEQVRACVEQKP